MASGVRAVATTALVVLLAGGAYVTADAYDVVPGMVTLAAAPAPPKPFPTAPGAVPAPAVTALLAALDPAAPAPAPAQLQGMVAALVADARMGASTGVVVVDGLTGDVLASNAPTVPHTPASTAKLVTAVAALTQLPASTTLPTRVVKGAAGQIVLVGGGDMMLAAGAGDPTAVDGRAGLADLAAQVAKGLKLAGTTTVSLGVDDTLFSGPKLSPTWAASDIAAGYVAPVTALAVDVAKIKAGEYPPRFPDPSLAAAGQLAARLAEQGITVTGTPARVTAPAGATELGVVRSAPIADVVQYFLHSSDNTITEVVARLVAVHMGLPGSFEAASKAVLRAASELGLDTSGATLVDASGLGAGSALPPQLLVDLVRLSTAPTHPELREVATGLPIAGLSGTLADRFTTTAARGLVRAKTGSLPHVTSLAGTVVDADGRLLAFAVLADQTPDGGQWAPRATIDAFVTTLQACGCR
ncbi:MAG TPA: D-alanyl-D-alanine carboxypeptidase/D-alanyl-D-alanine-endopeptidase [Cellulomonas sp.]|uniref:D-alanyl-D-alanine carboxypeptidase/D-alanyl-D-alanine endopeptidase n=1 Tax=Cellulomonas sp. TaxID=40001 RepID=UPI002E34E4B0|nr:D-alanyl-D-alanine carboxypeptidase/D-alanyl-D-alanine-endopeptidase [Cellulomonas sp.]HEX5332607.1 D-alanyl-D-alanine carboxypeptidase/D-alanyl-D-alanine-endopeptidase [Cellulomonas sp.]